MKVLHLDSGQALRGGQLQVLRLLEGLDRLGIEQTLLARGRLQRKTGAGPLRWSQVLTRARRADIIHAHDAHSHTLAALLAVGKPLVVSRRVAFPVKTGILSRLKYGIPSRFVAVSNHVKQTLINAGVAEAQIAVVYDGIDLPDQAPTWKQWHDPPRVAVLGSDDPSKRTAAAETACRRAGLTPVVDSDLSRGLANADIFLYLPELEGFGSAVLAAAARKMPVVASAVGGIPEAIVDGDTGLLTDGSVEKSAEALSRLATDEALAEALAERAFHRLADRFTSDIMVNRTAEIYRSVLRR